MMVLLLLVVFSGAKPVLCLDPGAELGQGVPPRESTR